MACAVSYTKRICAAFFCRVPVDPINLVWQWVLLPFWVRRLTVAGEQHRRAL
jgi:hypothetical protein